MSKENFDEDSEVEQSSSTNRANFNLVKSDPERFLYILEDTSNHQQDTASTKEKSGDKVKSQEELAQIYNQIGRLSKNNISRSEQNWEISEHMKRRLVVNKLNLTSQYFIKKISGSDNSVIVERTQAGELKDISAEELGKSLNACFDNRFPDNKLNHTESRPNVFLVTADTQPIIKDIQNVPKGPKKQLW